MLKISHKKGGGNNSENNKVSFPSFLSWPPSIAHISSHQIMQYNVLDGFYPWVREGCIACSRCQCGFQCSGDCKYSIILRLKMQLIYFEICKCIYRVISCITLGKYEYGTILQLIIYVINIKICSCTMIFNNLI